MTNNRTRQFQRDLLRWYAAHRRPLPWRKTKNPYRILVSEIMLQQTQVDRVWPFYERFLKRFPTFQKLARARRSEVLKLWSGLGYNRRAVHLHRLAREILRHHGGELLRTAEELEKLPGVGPYTASAVATFAFGAHGVLVETNVRRVLGRVFTGKHFPSPKDDAQLRAIAAQAVPEGTAAIWHHALMDLGAMVCKPKPLCEICPVRAVCRSSPAILQNPQARPKKQTKRFADSNRFWRGRILHAMQSRGLPFALLHAKLEEMHGPILPRRLSSLLKALEREGLLRSRTSRHTRKIRYSLG